MTEPVKCENQVMDKETKFEYTYSAKQQTEIEYIRKKYLPKEESKLEQLRRLDKSAEQPGMAMALFVGIIGTLFLGIGMCCTMVWKGMLFVPGIVIGISGIFVLSMAYPIYTKMTKKCREKIASQILALSEEISIS